MKEKIINILKQFEQKDYKRGGVSLAPEMYNTVAKQIEYLFDFNRSICVFEGSCQVFERGECNQCDCGDYILKPRNNKNPELLNQNK